MSTQHTPGPWYPVQVSSATGSRWMVQRVMSREPRAHEYIKASSGGAASFYTESEARAAIAKATGSAS